MIIQRWVSVVSRGLIFTASHRFRGETKIEHLVGRDFFAQVHALLGEVNGAAHPGVVKKTYSAETAELEIVNFRRQGTIFDAEIFGNDLDGFAPMLSEVLLSFQAGADKTHDFGGIIPN